MFEISLLAVIFALTATIASSGAPVTAAIYTTTAGALLLVAIIYDSHHMAYRDDLTGLPARRALQEALLKLGPKYTMAMLDIDHFKKFNDTHGHDVGDQVLKLVASKIRGVRAGGKPFRYGGEEFTVLFPRKRSDDVVHELERLREEVANSKFQLRAKDRPKRKPKQGKGRPQRPRKESRSVTVTISIGVAERGGKGKPEQVLKRADQALYRAKKGGRNRVST
jgi:diguanylate cyclase (GGDEF)-like protein